MGRDRLINWMKGNGQGFLLTWSVCCDATGGVTGWTMNVWSARKVYMLDGQAAVLNLKSPDGDQVNGLNSGAGREVLTCVLRQTEKKQRLQCIAVSCSAT